MSETSYDPPFFLFNSHLETIYPALFRRVATPALSYERISTPDDDFLDLTWYKRNSDKLVIIQHGLEGRSDRAYIKGMAKAFYNEKYDALTWDYRGCGKELNKQLRFYHSGETEDLNTVISYAIDKQQYHSIVLIGFSLGGNMTLKYLGERKPSPLIKRAVVFSAPIHLESACLKISRPSNRIYANRFLRSLKLKILSKSKCIAGLDISQLDEIKTLIEFDNAYPAPLHGFENAHDYYTRCSSLFFLKDITVPTLIVNTKNDPFLSEECFPSSLLEGHRFVSLEIPERGGHVGFTLLNKSGLYWSEQRALKFCLDQG